MTTAADVHAKLGGKPHATGYLVPCVAHEDRNPSLSISDGDGGVLLWNCKAGCSQDAVRDGLDRQGFDLKGERREQECRETVWTIRDGSGKPLAQHVRVDKTGGKVVFWRGPSGEKGGLSDRGLKLVDLPLYGAELVAKAPADQPVVITEGEKSADAARKLGLLGIGTVTGASAIPGEASLAILKGRTRVLLWPDNDPEGQKHMARIQQTLTRLGVKVQVVTWPDAPVKGDAADFVAAGKTRADFDALLQPRRRPLKRLRDGVKEALAGLDRYTLGDFSDRVQTGVEDLDRWLNGGLRHGQVTLIGAITGGGKTVFLQQVAAYAAETGPVLFITPEMGIDELAEREIIRLSRRRKYDRNPWSGGGPVRDGAVMEHNRAASQILTTDLPLYVLDDTATMTDVEDYARDLFERPEGLRLIAIDYAQEIADTDSRAQRNIQVADVARACVQIARRYRVPVLIASQVNVTNEKVGRGQTRREYTFRETAVLEQKANTVLILEVDRVTEGGRTRVEAARVICKKQRGGSMFIQAVHYDTSIYEIADKLRLPTLAAGTSAPLLFEPPPVPR